MELLFTQFQLIEINLGPIVIDIISNLEEYALGKAYGQSKCSQPTVAISLFFVLQAGLINYREFVQIWYLPRVCGSTSPSRTIFEVFGHHIPWFRFKYRQQIAGLFYSTQLYCSQSHKDGSWVYVCTNDSNLNEAYHFLKTKQKSV